jgi:hypothetical protein
MKSGPAWERWSDQYGAILSLHSRGDQVVIALQHVVNVQTLVVTTQIGERALQHSGCWKLPTRVQHFATIKSLN